MIPIRKSNRTVHCRHSTLFSPLFHSFQQRLRYFHIVNKVKPSKTGMLIVPCFIGSMIDKSRYASHYLPISICQIIDIFSHLQCRVLFRIESIHFIKYQWRTKIWVSFIEIYSELNEFAKFSGCTYLFNF